MEKKSEPEKNESVKREDREIMEKLRTITAKGDSALVKRKQDKLIIYRVTKKLS